MMRGGDRFRSDRRRAVRLLVISAGLAAGPVAVPQALAALSSSTPPPPASGAWVFRRQFFPGSGQFTVTRNPRTVSNLQMRFDGTIPACGTGTISLVGQHRIRLYQGTNLENLHYSVWAVGRNDPKGGNTIQPIKVTFERARHKFAGKLALGFDKPPWGAGAQVGRATEVQVAGRHLRTVIHV